MPWRVIEQGDEYCVFKLDADGNPEGEPLGCHATEAEAEAQLRALYASEEKEQKIPGEPVDESERKAPAIQIKTKPADEPAPREGITRWGLVEYKSGPHLPQDVEDRTVTGFASVFGVIDDGGDRLLPGAFAKTLREQGRRVRHLWQHDLSGPPIAVIRDIREVDDRALPGDLKHMYPEASGALQVTREYLRTPRAEEVLEGIKSGAIAEMSFGFQVPRGRFDIERLDGRQVRNLREVRLMETSDVLFGMNAATRAMKGLSADVLRNMLRSQDVLRLLRAGQRVTADDLDAYERVLIELETMLAAPVAGEAEPMDAEDTLPEDVLAAPSLAEIDPARFAQPLGKALLLQLAIAEREVWTWT